MQATRCQDISVDMPRVLRRNRELEAQTRSWKHEHGSVFTMDELESYPASPSYVVLDDDGWIAIDTGGDYYDFDAGKEIKTPLDLLEWVRHLCEKRWMDSERVRQLIVVVCEARGWKLC